MKHTYIVSSIAILASLAFGSVSFALEPLHDCWSMNIKPDAEISCTLSINSDASYYYKGLKGEKVTITVHAQDFVPQINIIDANDVTEFLENKSKQNSFTVTKVLPYNGDFTFEIYNVDAQKGDSFTIKLHSDVSNIQDDIRKDALIEGKSYSVKDLNLNQSTSTRKFLISAYVVDIYKAPVCSQDHVYDCKLSEQPNITISDNKDAVSSDSKKMSASSAIVFTGNEKKYDFELGKKYQFEVSVRNSSNTNVPYNSFKLLTVKDSDGTIPLAPQTADVQSQEKSFMARLVSWFKNLFK